MKLEYLAVLGVFASFVLLEIMFTGFFRKPGQTRGDGWVELAAGFGLVLLIQPMAVAGGGLVASLVAPQAQGMLASWPVLAQLGLLLIFDDLSQYWWHRASHSIPWLYKLHRPHHNAEYLSIRVSYRNNLFYYAMMPGLWASGALIWLGLGWVYAAYLVVKMSVIFAAHSDVRWDEPLYRIKWLSPVMWVVERTISTPATHSAHHGKHADDGITNYKGNFGNLLFFWDVLFGTAKITRRYPEKIGVENLPPTSVGEQLIWPLVRVKAGTAPAVTDGGVGDTL
ncbi:sterol desaturase family protein [uncultured Maricaulis sp.]|uniref:sterol desaturase family protein n=1 Tax=uncultured Maricaulis sp. TaxID=174710 RepID=UPI0030D8358F|tara:strand:- start:140111 stop:140956 length:846 start_codon:yes stop_codon:yes gene_type:complete